VPVVGKTAEETVARAETFRTLAEIQLQQDHFQALNVAFAPGIQVLLAEGYFALSRVTNVSGCGPGVGRNGAKLPRWLRRQ
jgi:hypothetical protein